MKKENEKFWFHATIVHKGKKKTGYPILINILNYWSKVIDDLIGYCILSILSKQSKDYNNKGF